MLSVYVVVVVVVVVVVQTVGIRVPAPNIRSFSVFREYYVSIKILTHIDCFCLFVSLFVSL
jgi:hypothetical protein